MLLQISFTGLSVNPDLIEIVQPIEESRSFAHWAPVSCISLVFIAEALQEKEAVDS